MPAFRIANTPHPPGNCILCGGFNTILVETVPELDLPGHGRVYVCAQNDTDRTGCAVQIAQLVGSLGKAASDELFKELFAEKEKTAALTRELSKRADPVVLSRDEYERLVTGAAKEE